MNDLSLTMMYSPTKVLSENNVKLVEYLQGLNVAAGANRTTVIGPGGGLVDTDFAGSLSNGFMKRLFSLVGLIPLSCHHYK